MFQSLIFYLLTFHLLLGCTVAEEKKVENGVNSNNSAKDLTTIISSMERASYIASMAKHAFTAYQANAWGHDYLLPVTANYADQKTLGSNGETILESLSTLWIMGLKEEFALARDWTLAHNLNNSWLTDLAPLLSAYALSRESRFLDRAVAVADYWLPRYRQLDKISGNNLQLLLSGPELKYLAQVTGDEESYFAFVDADYERYQSAEKEEHDFSGFRRMFVEIAYFLQYDVSDSSNLEHFRRALGRMTSTKGSSFDYSSGLSLPRLRTGARAPFRSYIAKGITKQMALDDCTYAGVLALAASIFHRNDFKVTPEPRTLLDAARSLTDTCYRATSFTPTHLPPETFYFDVPQASSKSEDNEQSIVGKGGYGLTPHLAQTYYLLYRITGENAYREMAWDLVMAIEKYCRVPVSSTFGGDSGGYSAVASVYGKGKEASKGTAEGDVNSELEFLDVQPSVFLGATLKYLYLIFAESPSFPSDQWVFTLTGHPLPAHGKKVKAKKCFE